MYQQRWLSKLSVEFEDVDARESAEDHRDEAQDISECHYLERKRHSQLFCDSVSAGFFVRIRKSTDVPTSKKLEWFAAD